MKGLLFILMMLMIGLNILSQTAHNTIIADGSSLQNCFNILKKRSDLIKIDGIFISQGKMYGREETTYLK